MSAQTKHKSDNVYDYKNTTTPYFKRNLICTLNIDCKKIFGFLDFGPT